MKRRQFNMTSETKYKYEFYIGCNDKDTKEDNSAQIVFNVQNYFLKQFGFYSMQVQHGAYTHIDNSIVCEKTCKIELILQDKLYDLEYICASLKELCNQESILVTCTEINGTLY